MHVIGVCLTHQKQFFNGHCLSCSPHCTLGDAICCERPFLTHSYYCCSAIKARHKHPEAQNHMQMSCQMLRLGNCMICMAWRPVVIRGLAVAGEMPGRHGMNSSPSRRKPSGPEPERLSEHRAAQLRLRPLPRQGGFQLHEASSESAKCI